PPENGGRERRTATSVRGGGVPIRVLRPQDPAEVYEAVVLDRPPGGLSVSAPRPFLPGAALQVCPARAPEGLGWVGVEVTSCSPEGWRWRLGCQFLGAPPPEVLLLFGR